MKKIVASVFLASCAVLAVASGCGKTYGPPSYPDGSITPDGCEQAANKVCEIASREQGSEPDYDLCNSLEAFGKLKGLCVSRAKCMGRPYYDCMMIATSSGQLDLCADEADRRCMGP